MADVIFEGMIIHAIMCDDNSCLRRKALYSQRRNDKGEGSGRANGFWAFKEHRKFRFGYSMSHYQTRGDSGIYIGVLMVWRSARFKARRCWMDVLFLGLP